MDVLFSIGDPVKTVRLPIVLGTVTAVIEPVYHSGNLVELPSILVNPAGKRYTTNQYFEDELELCRCANRSRGELSHA